MGEGLEYRRDLHLLSHGHNKARRDPDQCRVCGHRFGGYSADADPQDCRLCGVETGERCMDGLISIQRRNYSIKNLKTAMETKHQFLGHLCTIMSWMFTALKPEAIPIILSCISSIMAIRNYYYSTRKIKKP